MSRPAFKCIEDNLSVDGTPIGRAVFTIEGDSPHAVLDAIKAGNVAGRNVILSTGASNDPNSVDIVNKQIEELQRAGAKRVTVLGVGTKKNLHGVNERLRDISSSHGPNVRFLGPLQGLSRDRVHPRDYKNLAGEASSE
jgi:hypothetical protein